jgi:hypothetical protein
MYPWALLTCELGKLGLLYITNLEVYVWIHETSGMLNPARLSASFFS